MTYDSSPIPHFDLFDGFTFQEMLVNGVAYFIALTVLLGVLAGLLHAFAAIRDGFVRGYRSAKE